MVEMLESIKGNGFEFEKGKHYPSMNINNDNCEFVLIRQPNSPKRENWWCAFPSKYVGDIFVETEGNIQKRIYEQKVFNY